MSPDKVASAVFLGLAATLTAASVWRFVREPPPSQGAADLLVRVDQDGNGRIDPAEYARVTDGELPFRVVDADASGALEGWEIDAWIRSISPLRASMSWVPRAL